MMRRNRILNLLFIVGLFSSFALAQEGPISIESAVDKSSITIGDVITYTVTVTHDPSVQIEMPGLGANLGEFEIRSYDVSDPVKNDGLVTSRVDYKLSTFFTGEFIIPPLTIGYILEGDSTLHTLSTEKISIMVESMKPSEEGDIRDVKPPLEYPRNWWIVLRWYILGLAAILILLAAWWIYRRKKAGKGMLPVRETPSRPPHEVALEALQKLKESDLIEKGEIKQYYIEISEIIRRYIEGRYFIIAMEMTTGEVLSGLKFVRIESDLYERFRQFLEASDLVKFAKYVPSDEENEKIMEMAVDLVDSTKVVAALPAEQDDSPEEELSDDHNWETASPKSENESVTDLETDSEKGIG